MEQEIAMSNSKTLNCLIFLQSFLLINTVIFANIGIKKTKSNFCLKIIAKLRLLWSFRTFDDIW